MKQTPTGRIAYLLLLAFVAVIPVEDGIGFAFATFSKVFGAFAFAAWLGHAVVSSRVRRPSPVIWAVTAFMGWAAMSYFWSPFPAQALPKLATLMQMLVLVVLLWQQLRTADQLRSAIRAFLLGGWAAALTTFFAAQQGHGVEGVARYEVANAGPNNGGCLLVIAIGLAWYLQRVETDRRWVWFARAFVPVAVVGVMVTASRAALISLVTVFALMLLSSANLRPRRLLALAAGAVVIVAFATSFVPEASVDRLSTTQSELSGGSLDGRTVYWKTAFELFGRQPVEGIGVGMFEQEADPTGTSRRVVAHNAFISIGTELGLVGIALFLGALLLAGRALVRRLPAPLRRPWLAVATAWVLGATTLTWEVHKVTWVLLAFAAVQGALPRPSRPRIDEPETDPGGVIPYSPRREPSLSSG